LQFRALGQCSTCSIAIPLVDNDFSEWSGSHENYTFPCTLYNPGTSGLTVSSIYCFNHLDVPNWYSINGTPEITSGPSSVTLRTFHQMTGYYTQCASFGSQGIAANYPFLARGQYQVTLNLAEGTNYCELTNNA